MYIFGFLLSSVSEQKVFNGLHPSSPSPSYYLAYKISIISSSFLFILKNLLRSITEWFSNEHNFYLYLWPQKIRDGCQLPDK